MQSSSQLINNSFSEKYILYGDILFRICMVYLGNKEDAEEAMQEAFIKLMCNPEKYTSAEHEKAWLIRITINLCKDMLRGKWRKRVIKTDNIENYYDNPVDIQIMEQILKLSAKYKAVIQLYYFEDYSINQISETLRIKESAVKMRLKRGRDILKIQLEGEAL